MCASFVHGMACFIFPVFPNFCLFLAICVLPLSSSFSAACMVVLYVFWGGGGEEGRGGEGGRHFLSGFYMHVWVEEKGSMRRKRQKRLAAGGEWRGQAGEACATYL